MINIGNYTYSERTEEKFKRVNRPGFESFSLMYERRGREYMLSERLKIDFGDILIYDGLRGFKVTITRSWNKIYTKEEFYAGREEFLEQVILDYTFGVTGS
jgi:hypothetical protein